MNIGRWGFSFPSNINIGFAIWNVCRWGIFTQTTVNLSHVFPMSAEERNEVIKTRCQHRRSNKAIPSRRSFSSLRLCDGDGYDNYGYEEGEGSSLEGGDHRPRGGEERSILAGEVRETFPRWKYARISWGQAETWSWLFTGQVLSASSNQIIVNVKVNQCLPAVIKSLWMSK